LPAENDATVDIGQWQFASRGRQGQRGVHVRMFFQFPMAPVVPVKMVRMDGILIRQDVMLEGFDFPVGNEFRCSSANTLKIILAIFSLTSYDLHGGVIMRKAKNWNEACPNKKCENYGELGLGNIISTATYKSQSGPRRVFKCKSCGESFSETRGTVFFDLRTPEEKVIMALKMILVRVHLGAICFVLDIKEETILGWLDRAYHKADEINKLLMKDINATEVQLDEMWAFVKRKVSESRNEGIESPDEAEDGRQWIWVSYAPEFRLILAMAVGPRTLETALALIQMTASVVFGIPCFFSDGFSCYYQALVECYHQIKLFPKTGKPGRPKGPVKEPHPDLVYGQIVKEKKGGKLIKIHYRIRCGAKRLKQLGLKIGTTLLERLNLTIRQTLSPLARKTLGFCKKRENLKKQVVFFQTYYNFVRPHMSLREKAEETDQLFQKKWRQRTPGMAANITDHVWTFREMLTMKIYHVP
jgi:IS1 family transposase/transposase-like protein